MHNEEEPKVDLSISSDEMMARRDSVRQKFVARFHEVHIAMRAHRKVGDHAEVKRLSAELQRIRRMIHALENPMEEPPATDGPPDLQGYS